MLEFIASLMDVGGNVPMIGDADEGCWCDSDPDPDADVYRSLLPPARSVPASGDAAKGGVFDDKTRWLLGDAAEATFDGIDACQALFPVRRDFPDGGYFILGEDSRRRGKCASSRMRVRSDILRLPRTAMPMRWPSR